MAADEVMYRSLLITWHTSSDCINFEFDLAVNASRGFARRLPTSWASHRRLITDSGSDVAK